MINWSFTSKLDKVHVSGRSVSQFWTNSRLTHLSSNMKFLSHNIWYMNHLNCRNTSVVTFIHRPCITKIFVMKQDLSDDKFSLHEIILVLEPHKVSITNTSSPRLGISLGCHDSLWDWSALIWVTLIHTNWIDTYTGNNPVSVYVSSRTSPLEVNKSTTCMSKMEKHEKCNVYLIISLSLSSYTGPIHGPRFSSPG